MTDLWQVHLPVHHPHGLRRSLHGLAHLLVRPQRLDPERHRLELGAHGVKLLDVPTGADEIFGHDLAGVLVRRGREDGVEKASSAESSVGWVV